MTLLQRAGGRSERPKPCEPVVDQARHTRLPVEQASYTCKSPTSTYLSLILHEGGAARSPILYERFKERPTPPVYRPAHGGLAGIVFDPPHGRWCLRSPAA